MIAYFDTSALVPLLIEEPGSAPAARLWDGADRIVSVRVAYPEARAALAHARRIGRVTAQQLRSAVDELGQRCEEIDLVDIDDALAQRAGDLAEEHALRGYDAVHLAAAFLVNDSDLVLVAGDRPLLSAATAAGLATAAI